MKIINLIGKPLQEIVFFLVCFTCIIAPTINFLLILYTEIDLDILFLKYIANAITISYILTVIVYLTKKYKIIRLLMYSFVLLLLLTYLFLKISFGTNISPLLITMIAETNYQESSEFIYNYIFSKASWISLFIVGFILFLAWIGEKRKIKIISSNHRIVSILIIISMIITIFNIRILKSLIDCKNMNEVNTWYENYYPYAMDNISTLMYSLYIPHITSTEIENAIQLTEKATEEKVEICTQDSLNVIFVLGESYIKYHAHLYGYPLSTTPYMDKEVENGNLYVFQDMISPYNSTTQAVKNILCTNSISNGETWSESVFFPALFKNIGVR